MCGNTRNGVRTRDSVGRNPRFAGVHSHAATGFVCTQNEARNEHMAWSRRRRSGCRSWSHGAKVRPEPSDQFRPRVCEKRPRTQVAIVQNGVIVLAFCDQRKPAHISTVCGASSAEHGGRRDCSPCVDLAASARDIPATSRRRSSSCRFWRQSLTAIVAESPFATHPW
jgi:hypothetical protein